MLFGRNFKIYAVCVRWSGTPIKGVHGVSRNGLNSSGLRANRAFDGQKTDAFLCAHDGDGAQKKASVAEWLLMLVMMVRDFPRTNAVGILMPIFQLNDVMVLLSAARLLALRFSLLAFPHKNDKTCHHGGSAHEDGECP